MPHPATICLLFFGSGFAALVFEIAWCRLLLRCLGAGTSANACVFAGFMAGAALGALLGWRFPSLLAELGKGLNDNKLPGHWRAELFLRAYGRLELFVACTGIIVCFLLDTKTNEAIAMLLGAAGDNESFSNSLRFFISFTIMLLPCSAMGASYAALGRYFSYNNKLTNFFPILYSSNTFGAAVGSIATAFVLVPLLGIKSSCLLAATVNFILFGVVEILSLAQRKPLASAEKKLELEISTVKAKHAQSQTAKLDGGNSSVFASCVFLSGFLALVLELAWTRIFSLVFGNSVYSLGAVLLMVLLGVAFASALTQTMKRSPKWAGRLVSVCFLLAGLSTLASCYSNRYIQWLFIETSSYLTPALSSDPFFRAILARLILAFIFVFLPSAFLGSILPLASIASPILQNGYGSKFYAINSLGAILACLTYSLLLLPALTLWTDTALLVSLLLVAFLSLLIASLLQFRLALNSNKPSRYLALFLGLFCASMPGYLLGHSPKWETNNMCSGFLVYANEAKSERQTTATSKESVLRYIEGRNSTVCLKSSESLNSLSLASDGKTESTLPLDPSLISPSSDLSTHALLGGLPILFHQGKAKDALLIGLGSGVTASTLLLANELEHLHVAELEPAVLSICRELADRNGDPLSQEKLKSGRVKLHLDDARYVLSSSKNQFDIIVSQPADPWVSGSGDLFTSEFWQLANSRLKPKGIFCQWLQLYAIPEQDLVSLIDTFRSVFKSVYICRSPGAGELILIAYKDGTDDALSKNTISLIQESKGRLKLNSITAGTELTSIYDSLSLVYAGPGISAKLCQSKPSTRINTDDNPFVEYDTGRSVITGNSELDSNQKHFARLLSREKPWYPEFQTQQSPTNAVEMGNAYLRQTIQDNSLFKSYNERRANEQLNSACSVRKSPLTLFSRSIADRTLGKTQFAPGQNEAIQAKPIDDEDQIALFKMRFEQADLLSASEALSACKETTKEALSYKICNGFLQMKKGQNKEAESSFAEALNLSPYKLAALLGAAYASEINGNLSLASKRFKQYLGINPWDFETQLAYTYILCKTGGSSAGLAHAKCASQLRPHDASALILVLNSLLQSRDSNADACMQALKEQSSQAINAQKVLKLRESVDNMQALVSSKTFQEIVNNISLRAEDPKNGYKILGEP